jgi:hypothetical protein
MEPSKVFRYPPTCNAPGCAKPAVYKIAATWSDGTGRELKNYGLACEDHRKVQLDRALRHHQGLRTAEGETMGPVELYLLRDGFRDAELPRMGGGEGEAVEQKNH